MKVLMIVGIALATTASAVPANAIVTATFSADPLGSPGVGDTNIWSAGMSTSNLYGLFSISSSGHISLTKNQAAIWMLDKYQDVTSVSFHGTIVTAKNFVGPSDGNVYMQTESNPSGWYNFKTTGLDLFGQPIFIENVAWAADFRTPGSMVDVDHISWNGTKIPGAVPEPASWALMIAGFGMIGTAARRRRTSGTTA